MSTRTRESDCAPKPLPELVSLRAIAEAWRVSRQTARRILRRAGIRAFVFHDERNGTLRFSRDEVERYREQQREPLN